MLPEINEERTMSELKTILLSRRQFIGVAAAVSTEISQKNSEVRRLI